MIPFILTIVGGYLIGDSLKSKKFADGGVTGDYTVIYYTDIPGNNKAYRDASQFSGDFPLDQIIEYAYKKRDEGDTFIEITGKGDFVRIDTEGNVMVNNDKNYKLNYEPAKKKKRSLFFKEGGKIEDLIDIDPEVEKMTMDKIIFKVEFEFYDDIEEEYYFVYYWDEEGYYLDKIYKSMEDLNKDNSVSKELQNELEEASSKKMLEAVSEAIYEYNRESYYDNYED